MEDISATYENGVFKIKTGDVILYEALNGNYAIKRYPNGITEIIYNGKILKKVEIKDEKEFSSLLERLLKNPIKS